MGQAGSAPAASSAASSSKRSALSALDDTKAGSDKRLPSAALLATVLSFLPWQEHLTSCTRVSWFWRGASRSPLSWPRSIQFKAVPPQEAQARLVGTYNLRVAELIMFQTDINAQEDQFLDSRHCLPLLRGLADCLESLEIDLLTECPTLPRLTELKLRSAPPSSQEQAGWPDLKTAAPALRSLQLGSGALPRDEKWVERLPASLQSVRMAAGGVFGTLPVLKALLRCRQWDRVLDKVATPPSQGAADAPLLLLKENQVTVKSIIWAMVWAERFSCALCTCLHLPVAHSRRLVPPRRSTASWSTVWTSSATRCSAWWVSAACARSRCTSSTDAPSRCQTTRAPSQPSAPSPRQESRYACCSCWSLCWCGRAALKLAVLGVSTSTHDRCCLR
jgi:hypothetical protein